MKRSSSKFGGVDISGLLRLHAAPAGRRGRGGAARRSRRKTACVLQLCVSVSRSTTDGDPWNVCRYYHTPPRPCNETCRSPGLFDRMRARETIMKLSDDDTQED